ncbi:MAG: hypothetical protein RIE73_06540 [Coleofasciculus sp. C1-SOL-03]|uniref:hypothetical protein n=1 Tax=Coleofasciculus sp. C1-SOL-03 TaxID=3069522 RepID=UPI0032F63357
MGLTKSDLDGQFVLTQHPQFIPEKWYVQEKDAWLLATHPSLPITHVYGVNNHHIGWIIGYSITPSGDFCPSQLCFPVDLQEPNQEKIIETNLYEIGGRFAAIFLTDSFSRFYLDPAGLLATVYSLNIPLVASTPSLIDGDGHNWDEEIIKILRMPNSGLWYPSGLTPKKNVARLLPNHFLDLSHWKSVRHWPKSPKDLVEEKKEGLVKTIFHRLRHNITSVANHHPSYMSITAGRDSRMLLASILEDRGKILFVTFSGDYIDADIVKLLVNKIKLKHIFIKHKYVNNDQREDWFYRTGYCSSTSGSIGYLQDLNEKRAFLNGIGGEVGRCFYWRKFDKTKKQINAKELLARCHIPADEKILKKMQDWLSEVANFNIYTILDLMYIEQRLGCWAAPEQYGGDHCSISMLSPFSNRKIFESMLRLPIEYRWKQQLTFDICQMADSELVSLPFNDFTGSLKYPKRIIHFFTNTVVYKTRRVMTRPDMPQRFLRSLSSKIRRE